MPLTNDIYYGKYNKFLKVIDAPVVGTYGDMGIIGSVRIGLMEGTGKIIFDEDVVVDYSTIQSVVDALTFVNMSYNYFISYNLNADLVSGKSTGAAIALGLLYDTVLITGSIDHYGNLQPTGGLILKIDAVGNNGFSSLYIAPNQTITYVYEQVGNSYLGKKINLTEYAKTKYNMDIIEITNIKRFKSD